MIETYIYAYWGILLALATLILQSMIAAGIKAAQPGAVPGKINASLSHDSFVFRSNRTLMNSLENFPAFLGAAFLALWVNANPFWTGLWIWIFVGARLIHMVLYYAIATEKNPSPRSFFFLIGFVATIALLVLSAISLG